MITRLTIKDFRCITEAEIFPKRVNLVYGEEESGKSSILNAIRYLLTGRTQWTDGKGTGILDHVRDGAKKSLVEAATDDEKVWQRTVPAKGSPELLWPIEVIEACLCNRGILELPDDKQKSLFFGVMGSHLSQEKILAALAEWTPEFPDLAEWWKENHLIAAQQYPSTRDRSGWHNYCYDHRSETNGYLKEKKNRHSALAVDSEPVKIGKESIDKASKALEESLKKVSGAEVKSKEFGEDVSRAHAEWSRLKEQENRLEKLLENDSAVLQEEEKKISKIEILRSSGDVKTELKSVQSELTAEEKKLDAMMKDTSDCPEGFCARSVIREHHVILGEIRKKYDALNKEYQKVYNDEVQVQSSKQRADDAHRRIDEYNDELNRIAQVKEPPKPSEKTVDLEPLHAEVKKAQKDYESLREMQGLYDNFSARQKERSRLATEVFDLEREVARWEALANKDRGAFAPSGIKAQLLQGAMSSFVDAVNERMAPIGICINIQVEPWNVTARTPGSPLERPVKFHSHSAQARISAAIQTQIAIESGFGMIALDEHGMGPLRRRDLINFLLQQPVQSFVFTTLQAIGADGTVLPPSNPNIDDMRVFQVKDGSIVRV